MRRAAAARLAGLLVLAIASLVACDHPPQSPTETWTAVQQAIRMRDPRLLHDLADVDTLEYRRRVVRFLRGLLARDDPPEDVLAGSNLTPEDIVPGTEDEAVGRMFLKHSPLIRNRDWFLDARVEREIADGPDAACLELRGADGNSFNLWLVREPRAHGEPSWVVDFARSWSGQ